MKKINLIFIYLKIIIKKEYKSYILEKGEEIIKLRIVLDLKIKSFKG